MNKNFSETMDSFIREYYDKNKNSGCLHVTVKDEIIYEKFIGFANIDVKIPFDKNSMFTPHITAMILSQVMK